MRCRIKMEDNKMALDVATVNNMKNMDELMKILMVVRNMQAGQQINLLLDQMDEMERNHAEVMRELADIKQMLNEVLAKPIHQPIRERCQEVTARLMEQAADASERLHQQVLGFRQDLDNKAEKVVQNFKNAGVKALNNVCDFLGIQEKLITMRDEARSSEMRMKNIVEKVDQVEKELSKILTHAKNMGRIITGKEEKLSNEQDTHRSIAPLQILKKHFLKSQEKYSERTEKLEKKIEMFRSLERKASVLDKLSDHKEKVRSDDKDSHSRGIEHKRDEVER